MASLAATGGAGELSVGVAADAAEGPARGVRRKSGGAARRERRLNCFIRFVASGEWAGNAFGTLAFLWATVVLLGGYCKDLKSTDFWYATAMIFIEAFRVFSRNYRLDDQSLFRTTRAIRAINRPFVRMLVRRKEWNELVAVMGLSIYLIHFLPTQPIYGIIVIALIIFMSKLRFPGALQLMSRPRRYRRLLLWAVLALLLVLAALRAGESHNSNNRAATQEYRQRVACPGRFVWRGTLVYYSASRYPSAGHGGAASQLHTAQHRAPNQHSLWLQAPIFG